MNKTREYFENKNILVTGGAGTIGSEIVRSLLQLKPKVIRVLDINETGLFELEQELDTSRIRVFIGDIRDKDRLKKAIENVDVVFHAAALKHVPLCEYNPFEAIKTNVLGTQNLIDVALDEEVDKFVAISTDKVVNPVNVMGTTKLLAERVTIAANLYKGKRKSVFSVARFGNVLNSRGSILPILKNQIKKGGPVTLTDSEMTRFIMSISEATKLVLKAVCMTHGGEIFILKMPSVKIKDLIEVVVDELSERFGYDSEKIKIKIVGKRVGEKLHEELMTKEEITMAKETEDMFIVIPEIKFTSDVTTHSEIGKLDNMIGYNSKQCNHLNKKQIKELLKSIRYI